MHKIIIIIVIFIYCYLLFKGSLDLTDSLVFGTLLFVLIFVNIIAPLKTENLQLKSNDVKKKNKDSILKKIEDDLKKNKEESTLCKDSKYFIFFMNRFYLFIFICSITFYYLKDENTYIFSSITLTASIVIAMFFIVMGFALCIFSKKPKKIVRNYMFWKRNIVLNNITITMLILVVYLIDNIFTLSLNLNIADVLFSSFTSLYVFLAINLAFKLSSEYINEKDKDKYIFYKSPIFYFAQKSFYNNIFLRFCISFVVILLCIYDVEVWKIFNYNMDKVYSDLFFISFSFIYSTLITFLFENYDKKTLILKSTFHFFVLTIIFFVVLDSSINFFINLTISTETKLSGVFYSSITLSFLYSLIYYITNKNEFISKKLKKIKNNNK